MKVGRSVLAYGSVVITVVSMCGIVLIRLVNLPCLGMDCLIVGVFTVCNLFTHFYC